MMRKIRLTLLAIAGLVLMLGASFSILFARQQPGIGASGAAWMPSVPHVMLVSLDGVEIRRVPDLELEQHLPIAARDIVVNAQGLIAFKTYGGPTIAVYRDLAAAPIVRVPLETSAAFALSPDGTRIAVGLLSGDVQVWPVSSLPAHQPETWANAAPDPVLDPAWTDVERLDWSPDGRWLAGSTADGRLTIWDAVDGHVVRAWPDMGGQNLAWNPDSQRLLAGDNQLSVLSVTDGRQAEILTHYHAPIDDVAWSRDGNSVITLSGIP